MLATAEPLPETCDLEHRMFRVLQGVFRRSESDGTPVMIIDLGAREAAIPLAALRSEFEVGDHSRTARCSI